MCCGAKNTEGGWQLLSCDEFYCIRSKLAQLARAGETDSEGKAYTKETLRAAIEKTGLTVGQHCTKHGLTGCIPVNPCFNVTEYPEAKTVQSNSIRYQGKSWTLEESMVAFKKAFFLC
ncbi:MAG: hypothetical protein K5657_08360 [Desulfovibrio sp.]|nr:hypothetical protein [Desulfovibrio sp.]